MRELEDDIRSIKRRMFVAVSVIGILLTFSVFAFTDAYITLRKSVQQERIDYISEVSAQLAGKVTTARQQYIDHICDDAAYLNTVAPSSYSELESLFPDSNSTVMLFVDSDGIVTGTNGETVQLSAKDFIGNLNRTGHVETVFCSINQNADYWIFETSVNRFTISNHTYIAVLLAVPSFNISKNLEVSLFNGAGAAYVISSGGIILMKPQQK